MSDSSSHPAFEVDAAEHDGGTRSLNAVIAPMCSDVVDAAGVSGVTLRVSGGEAQSLPADAAIPVALIVAEAVANAIEHGFAGQEAGIILIRATRTADGALELSVIDEGAGLPGDFDLATTDSLGLMLAQMLARQLGGTFSLTGGDRTIAQLRLP